MSALAILLIAMQLATPMTVNDQRLGSPATFSSAGPAKVCLREMVVTAKQGEIAEMTYSGIHYGTLRLTDGKQFVEFAHGEIWRVPKKTTFMFQNDDGNEVYKSEKDGKLAYAVFVPGDHGKPDLRVWVTGTGLSGKLDDARWLRAMTLVKGEPRGCDRKYIYGWDFLLGTAPVIQKP